MQKQEKEVTIPEMVDDVRAGKMDRRRMMKTLALMGVSAAGAGAIASVAARQLAANFIQPTNGNSSGKDQLQQHDQHIRHQSTGDVQQLQNDYHENAIVEDSMHPHPFVGHEAIMARKNTGFTAMPDLQISVTNRIVRGSQLTVEWVASGTHTSDYPGLPASGRAFSIPGVTVVVRHNGKIVRESLYYDVKEVQRQLGPR